MTRFGRFPCSAGARLAEALAGGTVVDFDRNIANRLWAVLMGRGLVQPLDLHNGENPPSHPELLADLALVQGGRL